MVILTLRPICPAHHLVSVAVNTGNGEEATSSRFLLRSHAGAFSEEATPGAGLSGVSSSNPGSRQPFKNRDPYLELTIV
ncbi:MAG: hypothetical protein IPF54_11610 [Draconibacterium sp.]|nr:hypothetical protein [Draconibacterium sp.]